VRVCINRNIIGSKLHLAHDRDEDTFSWVENPKRTDWVLGFENYPRSIDAISKASGRAIKTSPGEKYDLMWKSLSGDSGSPPPWSSILRKDKFMKYVKNVLDQLWKLLDELSGTYYLNHFILSRIMIQGLQRPIIDVPMAKDLSRKEKHAGVRKNLERFIPDKGKIADKTAYSQTESVTGRLTVLSGPNILTVKKEYRGILKSRFDKGKILEVDFVSLEPRVALAVAGRGYNGDVYENIRDVVLKGEVTRDQAKIITLAALYGMSSRNLASRLPDSVNARNVLSEVKSFFEIPVLKMSIKNQVREKGYFENFYGRKIKDSKACVNHYIQSTGVDISLIGFLNLIKSCISSGVEVSPLFVVHDALILDIREKDIKEFEKIVSSGIELPGIKNNFPAKISIIR
jgi:hypothetical protein